MTRKSAALISAVLSVIGLGLCVYLELVHLALLRGELVGGSACSAAGTAFNCHAVTSSPMGTILGLPLALWGAVGYLATLGLSLVAWRVEEDAARAFTALFAVSLGCVLADAVLLTVMVAQIHYLCPLCLGTYAVNLLLVWASRAALRQPWRTAPRDWLQALGSLLPDRRAPVTWVVWSIGLTGVIGAASVHAAASYVLYGPPGSLRKQMTQFVERQPRHSVETSSDPHLGAPHGAMQMVEFSDFFCPSCQRASKLTPVLLSGHGDALTVIFKNFPLDQECNGSVSRTVHPQACRVAAAGECANEQGKFWPFHDLVFHETPPYAVTKLDSDVARIGLDVAAFRQCMDSGRGMEAVKRDVEQGMKLGIASTPTYLVNGVPISGVLSPTSFDVFLKVVRDTPPPPAPPVAPAPAPAAAAAPSSSP